MIDWDDKAVQDAVAKAMADRKKAWSDDIDRKQAAFGFGSIFGEAFTGNSSSHFHQDPAPKPKAKPAMRNLNAPIRTKRTAYVLPPDRVADFVLQGCALASTKESEPGVTMSIPVRELVTGSHFTLNLSA